jgi:Protein tyrosine and serine/threonine kinase
MTNDPPNYRPSLPISANEEIKMMCSLMDECWQEQPQERPTFTEILKTLRRINRGQ